MYTETNTTANRRHEAAMASLLALYHDHNVRPEAGEARKLADFLHSAAHTAPERMYDEFGLDRVEQAHETIRNTAKEIELRVHDRES